MTDRPTITVVVAVGIFWIAVGCGNAFTEDLTVDTDAIAADSIFSVAPADSGGATDTELTGTTTSFRFRKTWNSVTRDAFLHTLQAATDQETVLSWADCVDSLEEDGLRDITVGGFTLAGGYSVAVDYRYAEGQLELSVGGPNDLEPLDETAALPASPTELESQTCTKEELFELSRFVISAASVSTE